MTQTSLHTHSSQCKKRSSNDIAAELMELRMDPYNIVHEALAVQATGEVTHSSNTFRTLLDGVANGKISVSRDKSSIKNGRRKTEIDYSPEAYMQLQTLFEKYASRELPSVENGRIWVSAIPLIEHLASTLESNAFSKRAKVESVKEAHGSTQSMAEMLESAFDDLTKATLLREAVVPAVRDLAASLHVKLPNVDDQRKK